MRALGYEIDLRPTSCYATNAKINRHEPAVRGQFQSQQFEGKTLYVFVRRLKIFEYFRERTPEVLLQLSGQST
ncbi:hypothetical protein AXZ95_3274 [Leifsonia sp. 115AMFTsu3.1]|nr:hypothetical protein AXZ95_3274 [Leifsonia sp. 115AMFTsu3.1]